MSLRAATAGLGEMELRRPPEPASGAGVEVVHAAEIFYALGKRDLALSFLVGFAELSDDVASLAALANLAARNDDARAVLLVGKGALERGLPLDIYAFPDIGVPHYSPIGPALDRSIVYSVARTESEFNQRDVSPAKAVGLMQVTPEAGRDTAKRFSVTYDWDRLVSDPVYNTQMGAAELAALLQQYRGSHIMSFAGYNAGRGRVQKWVAQYGDPRDALSTQSIGSSAFHLLKRATTFSASWRICRSTECALAKVRRCLIEPPRPLKSNPSLDKVRCPQLDFGQFR